MKSSLLPSILLGVVLVPLAATAQNITKCQDAEGNWHYGNYASDKCADDKPVTELRESGVTEQVREAPPTIEELQAEQARKRAEREAAIKREEKLRIDRELLDKYASEDVIIQLRDQRIEDLERTIEFNRRQAESLAARLEAQGDPATEVQRQERHENEQLLDRYRRAIERARATIEKTRSDYGKLLERYRQIERP